MYSRALTLNFLDYIFGYIYLLYFDMVISANIDRAISIELIPDQGLIHFVTSGAELEFLPLTDFPIYRLAPDVIKKLKPIYDLTKINRGMITRQPHFNRLIQMLVTIALINHHANIEHPGNTRYQAKLNRVDFEKHKQAMLKTAYKYDKSEFNLNNQQSTFCNLFQNIKNTWNYIKLKQNKQSHYQQTHIINSNQIEKNVLAIFNRLELLGIVEAPGDNILKVGIDGSVHGTNQENIDYYENLYKQNLDTRFRFKIYSGQEIGFPVCESIEEIIDIYKFVVSTLKKNGVHFSTTSGVHLHVGIANKYKTTEEIINHLANITSVSAAISQVLENILPPTRKNNVYAMPFGNQIEQHTARYKKRLSKLEYIQKKINMVKQGVIMDADLLDDKDAAMYEFILGVGYGVAPIQHEYNYKKILEISAKTTQEVLRQASIIVRNPRYTSINITPFLQNKSTPTYEWRVLASCEDAELQGKFFTLLYRVIQSQNECVVTKLVTDYQTNRDYIHFHFCDGRIIQMENTLDNWLHFTECDELFTQSDYSKIQNDAYWKYYDAKNQEYISPENQNWVTGQFYPAPIDTNTFQYLQQDSAILSFLNSALNI
jgi:Putative amidoligase enzyme